MTKMQEYIASFERVKNARDVRIKIDNSIVNAVEYIDHDQTVILVFSGLPASRRRRNKTVYNFPGDKRDWYVACYSTPECLTGSAAEFHPFGLSYELRPWSVPSGEAIDHFEEHKYTRKLCDISRERF